MNASTLTVSPTAAVRLGGEVEGPDLTVYLLTRRALPREFARLAAAAATMPEGAYALEEQIAMMARVLHVHHAHTVHSIWPVLRERDPEVLVLLGVLQANLSRIDEMAAAAADRAVPLGARARVLKSLSAALKRHYDFEDDEVGPLLRRFFTGAEWTACSAALTTHLRGDRGRFVATMVDHLDPFEAEALLRAGGKTLRYRLLWQRKWAAHRPLIYGF